MIRASQRAWCSVSISADTSVRGASTDTTCERGPSRSTSSQSITMSAMSNGTWSSSSNGTAWASRRFSAKGKERRRTEMRSPRSAATTLSRRNDWMLQHRA